VSIEELVTIQSDDLSDSLHKNISRVQSRCLQSRPEGDSMASPVPINGSASNIRGSSYMAVSPEGTKIEIPKELFTVLCDFLQIRKDAGSMVVHFRNGGVAGLEALIKKRYK
jgi:hypothetical protein